MADMWGSQDGKVPVRQFSWWLIAGVGSTFVANVARSAAVAAEGLAVVSFGAANQQVSTSVMTEQASREIETLVSGSYWEIDTEEGVYVADGDEYDEDEMELLLDDEEDE